MTISLNSAIVRIRAGGHVVGAGFLVSERQVLTCAHVVAQSLGIPDTTTAIPQGQVLLDFPIIAPEQRLTAGVVTWQPVQSDGRGDVAGLEVKGTLPQFAQPAQLVRSDDLWNHPFRAFGFPHDMTTVYGRQGKFLDAKLQDGCRLRM